MTLVHPSAAPARSRRTMLAITILATTHLLAANAAAAVIHVTTLVQKISSSGGCSLQEAIYSANRNGNTAIAGYSGAAFSELGP